MHEMTNEEKVRTEGRRYGNFNRNSIGSKHPPENRRIEESMRRA
jgi:hypothetical protein